MGVLFVLQFSRGAGTLPPPTSQKPGRQGQLNTEAKYAHTSPPAQLADALDAVPGDFAVLPPERLPAPVRARE